MRPCHGAYYWCAFSLQDYIDIFMSGVLGNPRDPFLKSVFCLQEWPIHLLKKRARNTIFAYFKWDTLFKPAHNIKHIAALYRAIHVELFVGVAGIRVIINHNHNYYLFISFSYEFISIYIIVI